MDVGEFERRVTRVLHRRCDHPGAIGVCSGHDGYPCLGMAVSHGDGVVVTVHYANDPETTRRYRRAVEIIADILDERRKASGAGETRA